MINDIKPKIAVVYLLYYHNPQHVDDFVSAFKKITYPKDKIELVIVSNPHLVEGSYLRYIEENVIPLSGKELPHVTILAQKENLGFSSGNNAGADWAIENNFDYVLFHNNDGFFASNAIEPLVETMENDHEIGIAQSLLLLHPETELMNSSGNSLHFLGFGYCNNYRVPFEKLKASAIEEICYASGAAMMVSLELIKKYGAWDKDYFMYHEDTDWSFRLRSVGYKIVLVRDSVFYHKYQFSRSIEKFYWMERNRFGIMLIFFKLPTLLLLMPIAIVMEIALWIFAFNRGWWKQRIKVYQYWLKLENWKLWLKKRKKLRKMSKVTDKYLLKYTVPEIKFQDETVNNPVLKKIGNPIMKLYYKVLCFIVRW
ncbi:glycosyltransferase family 2 protein [Patescibacteria group bacterium]|nr:glycosyltransferase family 2 protein [Patescibacteria group bacterium]